MTKPGEQKPQLKLIATRSFGESDELYRVVDFLNKTLKHKKVLFGLTKDGKTGEMMISIYET
ncbi:MAG: DUF4264 domain-containing protein [Ammonifex sp.]|nr:MAG: DUF4264 domain-containing protein [Ammonifex sp.]